MQDWLYRQYKYHQWGRLFQQCMLCISSGSSSTALAVRVWQQNIQQCIKPLLCAESSPQLPECACSWCWAAPSWLSVGGLGI